MDDIEQKTLTRALQKIGPKVAGRVKMMDLRKLGEYMAEEWGRHHKAVHAIVRYNLERHLRPEDVYTRYGNDSYLVILARASEEEAQAKCALMARQITSRLLGESGAQYSVEIRTAAFTEDGRVVFELTPHLDGMAASGETEDPGPSVPPAEPRMAVPKDPQRDDLADIEFVFRPLLSVGTNVLSTFLCLPVRKTSTGHFESGYATLLDDTDHQLIRELDIRTLHKAASEIRRLREVGAHSLVALPIHFETLRHLEYQERYLEECQRSIGEGSSNVIFELIGLQPGISPFQILEATSRLRLHGRQIIARVPISQRDFGGFRDIGLHAVGIDLYGEWRSEEWIIEQVNQFAESAEAHSLKTYVHGVRRISLNSALICAGIDYVGGYPISGASNVSPDVSAFDIHTIYGSLMATTARAEGQAAP